MYMYSMYGSKKPIGENIYITLTRRVTAGESNSRPEPYKKVGTETTGQVYITSFRDMYCTVHARVVRAEWTLSHRNRDIYIYIQYNVHTWAHESMLTSCPYISPSIASDYSGLFLLLSFIKPADISDLLSAAPAAAAAAAPPRPPCDRRSKT